jgi:AraC-like DNA-binding protein
MKAFLKLKSVGKGMMELLTSFCLNQHIQPPTYIPYNDRVSFEQWLNALKFIDKQYKKEALGLEIANMINTSHTGISLYIARASNNLYEYLKLNPNLEYDRTWYDYVNKKVSTTKYEVLISWDIPSYYNLGFHCRATEISEELQVAIYYLAVRHVTQITMPIFNKVELAIPLPKNPKRYEDYFQCQVVFNTAHTTIHIKKDVLQISTKKADHTLLELLSEQAESQINKLPTNISFIELVNQRIIQAIKNQNPRLEIISDYLNMSPRTFQKALKQEGVKFQTLLNNARLLLAKQYLLDPNLQISTVSELLGYKEQTSFNRSFKQLTGESPLRWRELNTSPSD